MISQKNFQKPIDKPVLLCYNIKRPLDKPQGTPHSDKS